MATAATPEESYYAAAYEVAKGSVERARSGAEFVEKAAAAIATVYTGALALVFSVTDNPLPLLAIIPALYLGAALTCAAFYLAWPVMSTPWVSVPARTSKSWSAWFNAFGQWVAAVSLLRANFLRTALVALVFAVIFLPAPFVPVTPAAPPSDVVPTPMPVPTQAAALMTASIAATDDLPQWPTPPEETLEFQKIRYAAQVAEVARLREEANPTPAGATTIDATWIWLAAALAGVVLILLIIPWERLGTQPSKKDRPRTPPGSVIVIPYIAYEEEPREKPGPHF